MVSDVSLIAHRMCGKLVIDKRNSPGKTFATRPRKMANSEMTAVTRCVNEMVHMLLPMYMNTKVSDRNATSLKKHIVTIRGALSKFCRVYRPITIPQKSTATMPLKLADSAMVYARYGNTSTNALSMTHPSSQSPVIEMYLCSMALHAPTAPPINKDEKKTPMNELNVVRANSVNATCAQKHDVSL